MFIPCLQWLQSTVEHCTEHCRKGNKPWCNRKDKLKAFLANEARTLPKRATENQRRKREANRPD